MTTDTKYPKRSGALAALSLPMLMASLDTSIANTALPTLAHAFGASFAAAQWIVLTYLLAITTLLVSAGRLGDRFGRRRLLFFGVALFTVASLVCGAASSLAVLLAARGAQGLGAALMLALSLALVGESVPREQSGRAMGLLGTMSAVGTAFGPALGGLLVAAFGWRALFLVNVPVGVLNLALVARDLPADRDDAHEARVGLDPAGTALLAATLAAYALAMTLEREGAGMLRLAMLVAALAGAAVFALVESRVSAPLVRVAMFRDPSLSAGLAAGALVSTVIMSTLVVGPFYLSRALGLPAALVGVLLSIGPAVVALSGVPAGRLTDRFGSRRTSLAGLGVMIAGSASLALLPASLGAAGYVLPIVVLTSGYALFQTANNTAVMAGVNAAERGTVSGLLQLSRNLGLVTGASAMGAVFAFGAKGHDVTHALPGAVASGMHTTFAVAAALLLAALAISRAGWAALSAPPPLGRKEE